MLAYSGNTRFVVWADRVRHNECTSSEQLLVYLRSLADSVSGAPEFYEDLVESASSAKDFMGTPVAGSLSKTFLDPRDNSRMESSIIVLEGRRGVGKTSFIRAWTEFTSERSMRCHVENLDHFDERHKNLGLSNEEFYALNAAANLRANLIHSTGFDEACRAIIRRLMREAACDSLNEAQFYEQFVNQRSDFRAQFPAFGPGLLLAATVSALNKVCQAPAWIFIDNVDRNVPAVEAALLTAAYSLFDSLVRASVARNWGLCFHIIITARSETLAHNKGFFRDYRCIHFGKPDVLAITLRKLRAALSESADPKREMNFQIITADPRTPTLTTWAELGDFIIGTLESVTSPANWPTSAWGSRKSFHADLVNCDVRRFVKFWVHFMLTQNFEELWKHERKESTTPYQYLRALIRGVHEEHGGNSCLVLDGAHDKSTLFVNLFEAPRRGTSTPESSVRNYLVNIRLLQYCLLAEKGVTVNQTIADLGQFFDRPSVEDSIRFLVAAGVIDEIEAGITDMEHKGDWRNIHIPDNAVLQKSDTTSLYGHVLLQEFEYISAVAVVSRQFVNTHNADVTISRQPLRSAKATLAFFTSLKDVILFNLKEYDDAGLLENYRNTFFKNENSPRPWRSAVTSSLAALKRMQDFHKEILPVRNDLIQLYRDGSEQISKYTNAT